MQRFVTVACTGELNGQNFSTIHVQGRGPIAGLWIYIYSYFFSSFFTVPFNLIIYISVYYWVNKASKEWRGKAAVQQGAAVRRQGL